MTKIQIRDQYILRYKPSASIMVGRGIAMHGVVTQVGGKKRHSASQQLMHSYLNGSSSVFVPQRPFIHQTYSLPHLRVLAPPSFFAIPSKYSLLTKKM